MEQWLDRTRDRWLDKYLWETGLVLTFDLSRTWWDCERTLTDFWRGYWPSDGHLVNSFLQNLLIYKSRQSWVDRSFFCFMIRFVDGNRAIDIQMDCWMSDWLTAWMYVVESHQYDGDLSILAATRGLRRETCGAESFYDWGRLLRSSGTHFPTRRKSLFQLLLSVSLSRSKPTRCMWNYCETFNLW